MVEKTSSEKWKERAGHSVSPQFIANSISSSNYLVKSKEAAAVAE